MSATIEIDTGQKEAAPSGKDAAQDCDTNETTSNPIDDAKVNVDLKYYKRMNTPPAPMRKEAFYGLAGQLVKIAAPTTEACPETLLVQLLVCFGSAVGRHPWLNLGGYQHTNEFSMVVGATGLGRKGTSYRVIEDFMQIIAPAWAQNCIEPGFQTGEAMLDAIRDDKTILLKSGKNKFVKGNDDKRLLLMEQEFARLAGVSSRSGNPLSANLRLAFDSPLTLSSKSKTNPDTVTKSHVSVITHVTPAELMRVLNHVEVQNGFINRFIFVESRPVDRIPRAKTPDWSKYPNLSGKFKKTLDRSRLFNGEMDWSDEVIPVYDKWYMSYNRPGGSVGDILARTETHVCKLAMIYALLDCCIQIKPEHFAAALAVCDYSEQSARRIFGNTTGNQTADKIIKVLQMAGGKLTRTEVSNSLHHNTCAADLDEAFAVLVENHIAHVAAIGITSSNNKPIEEISLVS